MKELLYPFHFVLKVLERRQGQDRVRDLLKANEVIDKIKQHEDFTLTFRVLDWTSCGLIGVSVASLGVSIGLAIPQMRIARRRRSTRRQE